MPFKGLELVGLVLLLGSGPACSSSDSALSDDPENDTADDDAPRKKKLSDAHGDKATAKAHAPATASEGPDSSEPDEPDLTPEYVIGHETVLRTAGRALKTSWDTATDLQRKKWVATNVDHWFVWMAPLKDFGRAGGDYVLTLDLGVFSTTMEGKNPPYASIECAVPGDALGIDELTDAKVRTSVTVLAHFNDGDERSMDFVFEAGPCFPMKVGTRRILLDNGRPASGSAHK